MLVSRAHDRHRPDRYYLSLDGGRLVALCSADARARPHAAPATVVVPLDFARLPLIAVVGMLLYQEPLDVFVFLGALFIFGGNYLNIWTETRAGRSRV